MNKFAVGKNIKLLCKMKNMTLDQLADFLVDHGAEVPNEFCDGLCEGESCEECPYVGEEGDRRAWKEWLESEYDGKEKEDDQEPQEPESIQTDEQGDIEPGGVEKETDQHDSERSDGSGPARGKDH
jgi:hypothetical protein